MISIEVALVTPNLQKIISLMIDEKCSITEAIIQSEIQQFFPEYDVTKMPVGIFGKRKFEPDNYQLQAGDRIEIYRPLIKSPNQKRLDRAQNKQ